MHDPVVLRFDDGRYVRRHSDGSLTCFDPRGKRELHIQRKDLPRSRVAALIAERVANSTTPQDDSGREGE